MSLWTPDGERPVDPNPAQPAGGAAATGAPMPPNLEDLSPGDQERARQMAQEMAEAQQRILAMPAADIVANHIMGFYELAALHLSTEPPNFDEAQVAIDAMGAVVDGLQGRLGEAEPTLRDARSQIQMGFVQLKAQTE
ncbi:MAG: hypothetical protein HKN26_14780 [Acidimicrobiales bacterium]|nr:hypothetical protein [Acidimicrobiales bacterium]